MASIAPAGFLRLVKTGTDRVPLLRRFFPALGRQGISELSERQMCDIGLCDIRPVQDGEVTRVDLMADLPRFL